MTAVRPATETVAFVDAYCAAYRDLFSDVRSFDHFTGLHLGLISDLARKSLPAIGRMVGADPQALHHFVANADWDVSLLRQRRLHLTRHALNGRAFVLCLDETGDQKYGTSTDYVSRQYIGNLGTVETGVVSVNAYGVLDDVTFPLLFQVFKPDRCLKPDDTYQTKPTIASHLMRTIVQQGFAIQVVLADALYGESSSFIQTLGELGLAYVVAIRHNHGMWLPPGQRVRVTRWRRWERMFSDGTSEPRYMREVVYGRRHHIRYYQLTSDPEQLPVATTRFVMTNLPGDLRHMLGNVYGLRTWIEYGFKHIKNELGWADHRLTNYAAIERWWELVFSAYLMVSLQTPTFTAASGAAIAADVGRGQQHPWWQAGSGWKHTLNNLRLLIQPFCCWCLLLPWVTVVPVPGLSDGLQTLIRYINHGP
jgi:SRSO17 transposase